MSSLKERVTTVAFGLSLAAFAQACESQENSSETPSPSYPTPTAQEHKPLMANTKVTNIDNSPLLDQLTLDNKCGVLLKVGDKTTIKIPLDNNPNGLAVEFDLTLIKDQSGKLYFASLPVENGHSIA